MRCLKLAERALREGHEETLGDRPGDRTWLLGVVGLPAVVVEIMMLKTAVFRGGTFGE
jgi:hypothetical protein